MIVVLSSLLVAPCVLVWVFLDLLSLDEFDMHKALSMFKQSWRTGDNKKVQVMSNAQSRAEKDEDDEDGKKDAGKDDKDGNEDAGEHEENEHWELKQLFKNE